MYIQKHVDVIYLVTFPGDFVKVGEHHGSVKSLFKLYSDHNPSYTIEFFKCGDCANTKSAIINAMKSQDLHKHRDFFKDNEKTREIWEMFKEINIIFNKH